MGHRRPVRTRLVRIERKGNGTEVQEQSTGRPVDNTQSFGSHSEASRRPLRGAALKGTTTATYYEILGVPPDAGHDEVKRAFTALALRWHPDRQDDGDASARERAEWRMQEINAAWSVLRSPGRRAAYDEELARARRQAAAPPSPRPGTSAGVDFADQLVDPTDPVPAGLRPGRRRLGRWAPVLVVLGVLVGMMVATAYAAHKPSTDQTPPGVEVNTAQFLSGSCVAVYPGPVVEETPCDGPNSGRIASTVDYPRPCPPDTDPFSLIGRQLTLCLVPG
jgi:hypothetical protein